jgi:hypothetical protein
MKVKQLLAAGVIGAVAVLSAPTVAATAATPATAADYQNPEVAWVYKAHIRQNPAKAAVLAKYRCWGGDAGTHLWVSLKQGPKISAMTAEELVNAQGTSALARNYYDSHPGEDPGTTGIHCNGEWQVQRFSVNRQKGQMRVGKAWLQFCLFDSTAESGPDADPSQGFAYSYKFIRVHAPYES